MVTKIFYDHIGADSSFSTQNPLLDLQRKAVTPQSQDAFEIELDWNRAVEKYLDQSEAFMHAECLFDSEGIKSVHLYTKFEKIGQ